MEKSARLPGTRLEVRRLWLIVGWALVLIIIFLSVTPTPVQIPMKMGDKLEHVLAYAVLMFWFANFYERSVQRTKLAFGFIVMGIALEFIQKWTGYRTFEIADMVAGAAGVASGWIVAPPRMPNCLVRIERLLHK